MNDSFREPKGCRELLGGPVSVAGEVVGKVTEKGRKHLVPKNEGVGDKNNLQGRTLAALISDCMARPWRHQI